MMSPQLSAEPALDLPDLPGCSRLRASTCIVTGAGSQGSMPGTGAAQAVLFASEGANVVVLDIDERRARHTLAAIESVGGRGIVSATDVTEPDQCLDAVALAVDHFGSIDVLVNNAAIAPDERVSSDQLWQDILNLNLRGAKLMTDAAIPQMRTGRRGSIIMISSIAALRAGGGIAYSAAKAGMIGMAKTLAFQHGREGIRANVIAPGHVAIPMGLAFKGWDDDQNARALRASASMLGTEGDAWDVANAALFLASEESRYVTAATIPVDGGTTQVFPIVMYEHLRQVAGSSP